MEFLRHFSERNNWNKQFPHCGVFFRIILQEKSNMDLRVLTSAGHCAIMFAYYALLLNFVIMTSSSTSSQRHSVNAADVKPIAQSLQLQCPPCEKLHCSPRNIRRLRCKGGITHGVCNCCPVCAKLAGEACGGQWNFLGKCDRGLKCEPQASSKKDFKELMTPEQRKKWIPQGKCVKVFPHADQMDQPIPAYCRPRCTPEYCTKNSRAVCSASDNAEKTQSCHGDCQHTSCRACHYVEEDAGCGKCSKDDFDCIKAFGRCVKQDFCQRKKYPCRSNMIKSGLKFQCIVPECLSP